MSYRITITKISKETYTKKSWENKYTDEVFKEVLKRDPEARQYFYAETPDEREISKAVFEQTIDHDFPMMDVIKAFNNVDPASLL